MRRTVGVVSITAAICGAAVMAASVRPAAACSVACWPGRFVPGDGAVVPANLPAIVWLPSSEATGPSDLQLTRADAPTQVLPLTATLVEGGTYLVVPDAPLEAGVTYTIVEAPDCHGDTPRATFTVGPAAPLPTQLGALRITPEAQGVVSLETSGGQCGVETVVARARVELQFAADAEPWRDVLHLETLVDARAWRPRSSIVSVLAPGASWLGRGVDRVYTVCASPAFGDPSYPALHPGSHQVMMRASLPSTALSLTTEPATFTLRCELSDCDAAGSCVEAPAGCCASSPAGAAPWLAAALGLWLRRRRRS